MKLNSNSKILILGATGLIGHQVYTYLSSFGCFKIVGISKKRKLNVRDLNLDLKNLEELEKVIFEFEPNYIINCAGVLISESNRCPENAILLNAYLPHFLYKIAEKINAKVIQISTDCVFSGLKGNYNENDVKDGITIYSKTKSLGEIDNSKHLTLRTSVIGPEIDNSGEELFNWFMNQKSKIDGYELSIWSGVTTLILSKVIKQAIELDLNGVYNITSNQPISKFELLKILNKYRRHKVIINKVKGVDSNKSLIDTRNEIKFQYPNYDDQVYEMFELIKSNSLYHHYHNL